MAREERKEKKNLSMKTARRLEKLEKVMPFFGLFGANGLFVSSSSSFEFSLSFFFVPLLFGNVFPLLRRRLLLYLEGPLDGNTWATFSETRPEQVSSTSFFFVRCGINSWYCLAWAAAATAVSYKSRGNGQKRGAMPYLADVSLSRSTCTFHPLCVLEKEE